MRCLMLMSFIFVFVGVAQLTHAMDADEESAREFFGNYVELSDKFDTAVSDMYSDSARIMSTRNYPFDKKKELEVSGSEWKQLIEQLMPVANIKGDKSTFSDISVTIIENKARIKANRYSELKCYVDTGYYMIIERDNDGNYLIIEEYTDTKAFSEC